MAGLTWNPQSRETGLTRPNPAELLSDEVMRKLAFNPNARAYADGETRISQTQVVEERQLSETGKTPIVPANLRATVQRDGSVVLTFDDSNTKQIA